MKITIKGHVINITTESVQTQYGTLYKAGNDYGEPKVNESWWDTEKEAIDNEIVELSQMLSE